MANAHAEAMCRLMDAAEGVAAKCYIADVERCIRTEESRTRGHNRHIVDALHQDAKTRIDNVRKILGPDKAAMFAECMMAPTAMDMAEILMLKRDAANAKIAMGIVKAWAGVIAPVYTAKLKWRDVGP